MDPLGEKEKLLKSRIEWLARRNERLLEIQQEVEELKSDLNKDVEDFKSYLISRIEDLRKE